MRYKLKWELCLVAFSLFFTQPPSQLRWIVENRASDTRRTEMHISKDIVGKHWSSQKKWKARILGTNFLYIGCNFVVGAMSAATHEHENDQKLKKMAVHIVQNFFSVYAFSYKQIWCNLYLNVNIPASSLPTVTFQESSLTTKTAETDLPPLVSCYWGW